MVYVVIAFWVLLGLAVFFIAMRGGPKGAKERAARDEAPRESRWGHRLLMLGAAIVIAFGVVVPALLLAHNGNDKASEAIGGVHLTAQEVKGRELFAHTCVYCHTLAAVKSVGRIGPDLDIHVGDDIPTYAGRKALVESAILEGRARGKGDMPALLYQGQEAEDVAEFVAAVAGH
jgi:mono/diheme cytochrome c family protein